MSAGEQPLWITTGAELVWDSDDGERGPEVIVALKAISQNGAFETVKALIGHLAASDKK